MKNISRFLNDFKYAPRRVARTELGFNAFSLMSDYYHRENFYSDVIRELLDPCGSHGEGAKFLRLFLEFLGNLAQAREKEEVRKAIKRAGPSGLLSVGREVGRIDIKVHHKDWTIIIENKINGAVDQRQQLPGYVEQCRKNGENVICVVYLKASDPEEKPSDWNQWPVEIRAQMSGVLVPVAGYSADSRYPNLVEGWLQKCQLVARDFNVKSVIDQFSDLVVHQAGNSMDKQELDTVFNKMCESNVNYSELRSFCLDLPAYVAEKIRDRFKDCKSVRSWIWPGTKRTGIVSVLDDFMVTVGDVSYRLAMDVECEPHQHGGAFKNSITFFSRNDNGGYDLEEMDLSGYNFAWNPEIGRQEWLVDTDDLYRNLDGFCEDVEKFIKYLTANREHLFK